MRPRVKRLLFPIVLMSVTAALLCRPVSVRADVTVKTDTDLTTREIGAKEVFLGDIVADAMRIAAKSDIAFVAATSFSDGVMLPKGTVNTADVASSLVYKSENVVIVKLTGDQVLKAMEQSLFLYPKSNSAFLQFSGLVVTFKPEADAGKRVVTIKLDGETVEPKKMYHVAMPAPLANGGLAYFKVWQKSSIEKETEITIESALAGFFVDHKTIAKGEDRLVNHK